MYFSVLVLTAAIAAGSATGDHHNSNLRHHHQQQSAGGVRGDEVRQVLSQGKVVPQQNQKNDNDVAIVIQGQDETVTIVQESANKEVITITQNMSPASGILTESDITISQTIETRDLVSNSRSRPMSSHGGVTYTFDPNLSFTDTFYFKDSMAIVWDPNTINSLVDDILLVDDNPSWPSIVQSTFNDDLTEVTTVTMTYQTSSTSGQALYDALTAKRQELMTSSSPGSTIIDTTGSRTTYKTTHDLDNGQVLGPSSQYGSYAWFLSNSDGFYSGELTINFAEVSNSDYKVDYYEGDTGKISFEYVYMDDIWPNRQVTEQVVYETIHAPQLVEFLQTKFY